MEREVHPDTEHRGEQRVRERADEQPQGGDGQRFAERLATGDVENILQPGEAHRGEPRVDKTVGQGVEFAAAPARHHQKQKQALGRLLDHRRADGHRSEAWLVRISAAVERQGDEVYQCH